MSLASRERNMKQQKGGDLERPDAILQLGRRT
jgi:hypothetical protein